MKIEKSKLDKINKANVPDIPNELKALVENQVIEAIKNVTNEFKKEIQSLSKDIHDLKVEIEILKEGGDI